jgi:ribonucleoside-diphosphate reductase alpha chain
MAKNGLKYSDDSALAMVDEYAEAWSYYLIKASIQLAKEKKFGLKPPQSKYIDGILPIDTYKAAVDELVPHNPKMDWDSLRADLKTYGIRNSTLMAIMPAETSAQIANATNGIEPPRALVSVKQSKEGSLRQVVPQYSKLKNKYELLWDQKSPEGYLKICAVLQKYIDQSISTNTSYNPKFYEEEKIPMSEMLKHFVMCYKYGIKTLYYFNTNDQAGEIKVELAKGDTDTENCETCTV